LAFQRGAGFQLSNLTFLDHRGEDEGACSTICNLTTEA